ncbi:molybdopterin oxidoreductase family protein [Synechococcus sp. H55.8]|uniref:molybdopterin oxidoreductase family protein n=1 Tax=Synechococcus sp. H55.8 TaxID=2964510 RepID=UPI0039C242B6
MDNVRSLCPYCGVGCGLEILAGGTRIRGDRSHPSSQGMVCVKGATLLETLDHNRATVPLYRSSLRDDFQPISWDQALDLIVERIRQSRPERIAIYGSGQLHTEDYYVAQKLLKGCLGSNNFDSNSRLCMSSAVEGYCQSLGSDGPPCSYSDLDSCELAFLIGTNTAECHPILFNRLRKRHKSDPSLKVVVVDPRRTETAEGADLYLGIAPGSDIDLLNGIAHLLIQWGAINHDFIAQHTEGFETYAALVAEYTPARVASRCGIEIEDVIAVARLWQHSRKTLSMWSMGLNQSSEGTAKVTSLINLHLLTGQIGFAGAGPFSLTGQPNAMGGREAGGLAHLLPGYRKVTNPEDRAAVEQYWQLGPINPEPGLDALGMIRALEAGALDVFWIAATNPLVSLPDLHRVAAALSRSPFTIVQDAYFPTETTAYAHLVLPAAQWGEKTGTMTNSERRVTLCPAWRHPPGEARADWEIWAEVGRRLGFAQAFSFADSAAVFAEYVGLTAGRPCDLSGLSHELLHQGPQQWPYPRTGPIETRNLYINHHFPTPTGRARFIASHSHGLAEPPDPDYPYVLTTGRLYGHWHTQTRTGHVAKIRAMHPQPFLEIHPRDADRVGLTDGDWVRVESRRGKATLPVKITRAISPGTVFMPMHWGPLWGEDTACNALTHSVACPSSKQPELKACAVRLSRIEPLSI